MQKMIFDWLKAAEIMRQRGVREARMCLEGIPYSMGLILRRSQPVHNPTTTFGSSVFKPLLVLDTGEYIDCYVDQDDRPEWNENTFWPQVAKDVLAHGRQGVLL